MNATRLPLRAVLISCSALGCVAGLLAGDPRQRFAAALVGATAPFVIYGAGRTFVFVLGQPVPRWMRLPARTLLMFAAIGCVTALLAWPETPQQRFLAVLLGTLSPLAAHGVARLLCYPAMRIMNLVRQHRWRQFGLRGLLAFTIVCAFGALIWSWTRPDIRYRRMRERQEFAAAVERLGGNISYGQINLNGQVIVDSDLEYLASLPGAKQFSHLNLNSTGITDEAIPYLNRFPSLSGISMNACLAITDGALKQLHGTRRLRFLDVRDTQVTSAGVLELKRANHSLLVYWGITY